MTIAKRIRLLKIGLVLVTVGEIISGLLALLTGSSLTHVLLIYGIQLVFFSLFIISVLRMTKDEENRQRG
jgi:hypothetical protein